MDLTNVVVIDYGPHRLALLPERAILNLTTGDLYLADLHIGKSAAFRARAIPVPDGDTGLDLERLSQAMARVQPKRLVILGDFLHGREAHVSREWLDWRETLEIPVLVVRGNHDQTAGDPSRDWGVEMRDAPHASDGLVLKHHPEPATDGLVLAGHVHPAVRLRGGGRDSLLLPCFHVGPRVLVLPAFTMFSGGFSVSAAPGDRVFAIAEDTVMDVTALAT